MNTFLVKLNIIFEESHNMYLRFLISLTVSLLPFLITSLVVYIGIHNPIKALVLTLLFVCSLFEKTRDNKIILSFVGLIPLGFYIGTSPVILSHYLLTVFYDLGSIVNNNKITTFFSVISIYGTLKGIRYFSDAYMSLGNTWIGSYFFPLYVN